MAYSWAAHVIRVCGLFHKDGSGLTRRAMYAEDVNGNSLMAGWDPAAVKWSLIGANGKILVETIDRDYPRLRYDDMKAFGDLLSSRTTIMMKMFFKAGIPLNPPGSTMSTALIKFCQHNDWPAHEKLLRDAYKLVKSLEINLVRYEMGTKCR